MDSFIFIDSYDTTKKNFKTNSSNGKYTGIYGIFCEDNKTVYVGSSIDILRRITGHKGSLKKGKHCNEHLQGIYNKYKKLRIDILETFVSADGNTLKDAEINWIEHFNKKDSEWKCINIYFPVDTWKKDTTNWNYLEERRSIYQKHLGNYKDRSWMKTPEYRQRMSDMFKGRECTWKENLLTARHKRPLRVYSMFYTVQTPEGKIEEVHTWENLKKYYKEYCLSNQIQFHKRGNVERLVKEKECAGWKLLKMVRRNVLDGKEVVKYLNPNFVELNY